ncbi:TPA: HAD-IA family hydrolase [Escherichia coli]|nr:HAD-IA family hydrolase [Escherichia coli]
MAMIFNAKGFLFDMDGTLVDSTAVVESVWRDFCAEYGLDSQAVIAYAHGRQTIDTLTHFIGAGEKTNKIAASLEEVEINTTEGVTEVKGAAALLSKLPPDSWALVTSAGRMLAENRMKAANLPLPRVMVCAEDVMTGKPSPEGYIKAALALGLETGECVVFEDASVGIKAGLASGASVIAVQPDALGSSEAHAVSELSDIMVKISGERFNIICG